MRNRSSLAVAQVLLAGCTAVFAISAANGQGPGLNCTKETLVFQELDPPEQKAFSYGGGDFKTRYDRKSGRSSIQGVTFPNAKYGYTFGTNFMTANGDLVGVLGGVFRSRESGRVFDRIPDEDVPKGVKVPTWDSITVPLTGATGFGAVDFTSVEIRVLDITKIDADRKPEKDATAVLQMKLIPWEKPRKRKIVTVEATIKAGDRLLINGRGHLVRAIVPADKKTRVVGWVELSPEPIPEADLIRDKKAFVRPMEKKEEKK